MRLADLRRGPIPAETGRRALTSWDELEPDPDDGAEDGDDSVHADVIHPGRAKHAGRDAE